MYNSLPAGIRARVTRNHYRKTHKSANRINNQKAYNTFNAGNDPEDNAQNFFKHAPRAWHSPWSKQNKVLEEVSNGLYPKPKRSWNPFGGRRTRKRRSHYKSR